MGSMIKFVHKLCKYEFTTKISYNFIEKYFIINCYILQENGSNLTYNSTYNPEDVGCFYKDSISALIPTTSEADALWAQCVIQPKQGDAISSQKKNITINKSFGMKLFLHQLSTCILDLSNSVIYIVILTEDI
jgi:hypothetical protein